MDSLPWFNTFLSIATFSIVTLIVDIVAVAILNFFQKRTPNKDLTFFVYAFISAIISNITHIAITAVRTWAILSHLLTDLQTISVVQSGISMLFSILFALLLSLGLLHLLGYESKIKQLGNDRRSPSYRLYVRALVSNRS